MFADSDHEIDRDDKEKQENLDGAARDCRVGRKPGESERGEVEEKKGTAQHVPRHQLVRCAPEPGKSDNPGNQHIADDTRQGGGETMIRECKEERDAEGEQHDPDFREPVLSELELEFFLRLFG
jgi:hypothetical protein